MSKYNHIKSIPIESIPKEEISQAIKEWAEGDDSMEALLWACYHKKIKTNGCHAGSGPYISFKYQENIEALIPAFEVTEKELGSQILVSPDGGNPFSGPEWHLASIGLGIDTKNKKVADIYFDKLSESIEKGSSKKEHYLLRLLEFFVGKESALAFRFTHDMNDKYSFCIESSGVSKERKEYYQDLFTKAGLTEIIKFKINPQDRRFWVIESNQLDEFLSKLDSITDFIIDNYILGLPKSEDEFYSFNNKALFKKRTLSEEEFNEWLMKKGIDFGIIKRKPEDKEEKEQELDNMLKEGNQKQNDNNKKDENNSK